MPYRYAVVGAGRQGTAAAYDLGRLGEAELVLVADLDPGQAREAADRVNRLLGRTLATSAGVDVRDEDAVVGLLRRHAVRVAISGVPYFFNLGLTRAALRAGTSLCDFGGNTALVRDQLALDGDAQAAGVTLVPDCGQVPGLGTSLCAHAIGLLDEPREVLMYDGGIPQGPEPPWRYALTFNIEGLTNEYFGHAVFLEDGQPRETPCFEEYELVTFPGFGELEAFTTAGGTSTMPWTYAGRVQTLKNKTLRWPGHYAQWKAFRDAGLLDLDPVAVDGVQVAPRHLLHAVLDPRLRAAPGTRDAVIVRVTATGRRSDRETVITIDLVDYFDETTGFTAMERTTGWHAAIMAGFIARGRIRAGAVPVELAVPGPAVVAALEKRGVNLRVDVRSPGL